MDYRHRGLFRTLKFSPLRACLMAASVLVVAATAAPAQAAEREATTKSVVISDPGVTLTFTFDKPIPLAQAEQLEDRLDNDIVNGPFSSSDTQKSASAAPNAASASGTAAATMFCGTYRSFTDAKATTEWRRNCNYTSLDWVTKFSSATQSTVVGTVDERGMSWWVNGTFKGQNAHHNELAWYQFHGTLPKIGTGMNVDYSDYYKWRHNIGPGGTAVLSVAGSIATR